MVNGTGDDANIVKEPSFDQEKLLDVWFCQAPFVKSRNAERRRVFILKRGRRYEDAEGLTWRAEFS